MSNRCKLVFVYRLHWLYVVLLVNSWNSMVYMVCNTFIKMTFITAFSCKSNIESKCTKMRMLNKYFYGIVSFIHNIDNVHHIIFALNKRNNWNKNKNKRLLLSFSKHFPIWKIKTKQKKNRTQKKEYPQIWKQCIVPSSVRCMARSIEIVFTAVEIVKRVNSIWRGIPSFTIV